MPFTPAALRFFDARCCLMRRRLAAAFSVHHTTKLLGSAVSYNSSLGIHFDKTGRLAKQNAPDKRPSRKELKRSPGLQLLMWRVRHQKMDGGE
jgi:hypothetical protein